MSRSEKPSEAIWYTTTRAVASEEVAAALTIHSLTRERIKSRTGHSISTIGAALKGLGSAVQRKKTPYSRRLGAPSYSYSLTEIGKDRLLTHMSAKAKRIATALAELGELDIDREARERMAGYWQPVGHTELYPYAKTILQEESWLVLATGPHTAHEIGNATGFDPSTIKYNLDNFRTAGVLESESESEHDGAADRFAPTDKGVASEYFTAKVERFKQAMHAITEN